MSEKIKIKMFGRKEQLVSSSCGWGPSTSCGPSRDPKAIEVFEDLETFIENTDLNKEVDIKFVDIDTADLGPYQKELIQITPNLQLPVTFIDGKAIFSGQVDNMEAYLILKRLSN